MAFETRAEIALPPGSRVADAVLADLDNDGQLDLAVTTLTGTVEVLLGSGNGTFQAAQSLPAPGFAFNVAAADLDDDSDLDLIVVRSADQMVSVFENQGAAQFAVKQEFSIPPDADHMTLGDCNGDGFNDVVLSHWHPVGSIVREDISLFFGTGSGTFVTPRTVVQMPSGGVAAGIAIEDFDADGLPDIIVANKYSSSLVVFRTLPGGGHVLTSTVAVGECPISISSGDLDGDGDNELVVSNFGDETVTVLRRETSGFIAQVIPVDGAPGRTLVQDVTGDGIGDLVVCTFERARLFVFRGESGGGFGAEIELAASGLPFRSRAGDVNGDGLPDLLVTGSGTPFVNLYFGRQGDVIGSTNLDPGVVDPDSVAVGDLNGDGRAEVVVAGVGGSVLAVLGLPQRQTNLRQVVPVLTPIDLQHRLLGVVGGDFDDDGRFDVAVATDIGVKLLLNRTVLGTANIDLEPVPPGPDDVIVAGAGPFGMAVADLDGDGRGDLVVADAIAETVTVVRSTGPGTYELVGTPVSLSGLPAGVAIADFTGDGVPDVAVARNAAALVTVLQNDGTGVLTPWVEEAVGAEPNYLITADFDRDGQFDLATSNTAANEITVLLGRPAGFLVGTLTGIDHPTALLAQDIDRNGAVDLVVTTLDGDFRIFLGIATGGGFAPAMRFPGTYKATSAGLGDIDGDGLADLVIASTEARRVSIYRNLSQPILP